MKRAFVLPVVLAVVFASSNTALSQSPAASSSGSRTKIGLIDMAEVFKKYKKFEVLRESLRDDATRIQEEGQQKVLQIQRLQEELKELKQGTAEFTEREKSLVSLNAELQAFGRAQQREQMRKEAQIYRTVYLEIQSVVGKFADHFGYTLILRFNNNGLETENPEELLQGLAKQVIFHRSEDDITTAVIEYLNGQYDASLRRSATNPGAGGSPTGTRNQ